MTYYSRSYDARQVAVPGSLSVTTRSCAPKSSAGPHEDLGHPTSGYAERMST